MTKKPCNFGEDIWLKFAYFMLGLLSFFGFLIPTIISLPIFLYRWAICEWLAPICRKDSGKAVTLSGAVMATELETERPCANPRIVVVLSFTLEALEGFVTFGEFTDLVQQHWINAKESNGKGLKYPEFQQYIERWMGYLFWSQDKSFNLANHLKHHKCKKSWTERECEQYGSSLMERLLNKPFPKRRSPWEVHMISNYKESDFISSGKELTKLVCRFHHSLSDGFGVFSVILQGLYGIPLSSCALAKPSPPKSETVSSALKIIVNFGSFPFKLIHDLGYATSLILTPVRTPWYIPEYERTGRQLYARSGKLPISKLKFVKDKFGVSFTSTLLSCVSAGIASSFKSKGFPNVKNLPFGSPVPLKGHSLKLTNHWTATLYNISIDQTLGSLERLKESEKHFQNAKQSTYPHLFLFFIKLAASHLPCVSRILSRNQSLSAGLTNFPGPGVKLSSSGIEWVGTEFGAGLLYGVAGLGFMVLSYDGYIRISIVAENAAMERDELEALIKVITDEIDQLYELARRDI